MKNLPIKKISFYLILLCLVFSVSSCQNEGDKPVDILELTPKHFDAESDACTLTATMSGFETGISFIYIDGIGYDMDCEAPFTVLEKNKHIVSSWFEVKLADDYSNIQVKLTENNENKERTLNIVFTRYSDIRNVLSIIQKGK